MDAEIAWANAPYVPIRVEEGGLGTASPRGALDDAVKLGYSFFVNYVPKSEYPFRGWQAKLEGSSEFVASWTKTGQSGSEKIEFAPRNEAGTEVEIFVYVKPDQRILIGPLGADNPELSLRVDEGGTGTASPRGSVAGVKLGFPFAVSFLPHASYEFYGWQTRLEGSGDLLGSWNVGTEAQEGEAVSFVPQNLAGTEIAITIHRDPGGTVIVEPLNGNNPFLAVELNSGGLGTIASAGTLTGVKQGFSFSAAYLPAGAYPFKGWQARYEGETELLASWTGEGASGDDPVPVVFVSQNSSGTEMKITVLINPLKDDGTQKKIVIGPLGADSPGLSLQVDEGGTGTANPRGSVSGIRLGFPFQVSFLPNGDYDFSGWQVRREGSGDLLGSWNAGAGAKEDGTISFVPQNIAGTEIAITIHQDPGGPVILEPLNGNNPFLAVELNSGKLGTITPAGNLTGVKQGFAFNVVYLPAGAYPFKGWQARFEDEAELLASWTGDGKSGADKVTFEPQNIGGTEVRISVLINPLTKTGAQRKIVIGPLGADNPELRLQVDEGGTGTANPRGSVSGIRLGFPFQVSFLPNGDYDFAGWQVRKEGNGDFLGSWNTGTGAKEDGTIGFAPQNIVGTEITITIHQDPGGPVIVEPLGANNPFLEVELSAGNLGTISPAGTLTGVIKQGYSFNVVYLPAAAYPFKGWQARLEGETAPLASWTSEEKSGADKVSFTPQNIGGTEVKIKVLINPLKKIIIGPLGMDSQAPGVEVYFPDYWGRSPQLGKLSGVRQGFPFSVEFTVSESYAFTEWRAYRTAGLGDKSPAALEAANPLTDKKEAEISGGADGRATVTINTTEAVTLIPWCEDRPRIAQTSPPLINAGVSYSRGQTIKIWFATPLDSSTVKFGEGFIEIAGQQTVGESSEPYDDSTTAVDENGDLTGRGAGTQFFKNPEYDQNAGTITIRPENAGTGTALPPGDIVITVTVGRNVLSPNGNGMTNPVSFYYRTNTFEVKNVYTAENIWAIHDPGDDPSAEKFFYPGADISRDRRLRKNGSAEHNVTLYFTVRASNQAEMPNPSTHLKIVELHYANLLGEPVMTPQGERAFPIEVADTTTAGSAGELYRQSNSGAVEYYKITYKWDTVTEPPPGIIRLIVLPYRDDNGNDDVTELGDIAPDSWANAYSEGRFATVVFDNQPPGGSAVIAATGFATKAASTGGLMRYNYGEGKEHLTFTVDFSGVADNAGDGIGLYRASMDKPWTMDNATALQWQYQIVDDSGTKYPPDADLAMDASWKSLGNNTVAGLDLDTTITSKNDVRSLKLRYRDALGNGIDWFTAAYIYYYKDSLAAVGDWHASYNPDDNTISVGWTNPTADFIRAEAFYAVDGSGSTSLAVTNATTPGSTSAGAVISGVPRLDVSGVRNGMPVGGARRYDITIRAHSATSQKDVSFKIWNFGTPGVAGSGMSVSDEHPAREISTQAELKGMENDANKKYVLANDIILSGVWTPIGTGSGLNAFKGKFYGNGHTITVGNGFSDAIHIGIFGYTGGDAVIRGLAVVYNAGVTTGGSATHIGGIVGYAGGSTAIRNCIVSGTGGATLSKTSASAATFLGGMVGYMEPGARIVNGSSSLNVHLGIGAFEGSAGGAVGGIAIGTTATETTSTINVDGVSVLGNVSLEKTGDNPMSIGGVVGASENSGSIKNVSFAGTVSASRDSAGTGVSRIGGIVGYASRTSFDNCFFTGIVKTPIDGGSFEPSNESDATGDETRIGGIIGHYTTDGTSTTGASPKMTDSISSGAFFITHSGTATLSLGGVVGLMNASGNELVTIRNCGYERGNIILERASLGLRYYDQVGGFAGKVDLGKIESCASLAGLIRVTGRTVEYEGSLWLGGFVSEIRQESDITKCYSTSPVEAYDYSLTDPITRDAFRGMMVGGFAALVQNGGIVRNCYATGDVIAYAANQRLAVGGFVGRADKYDQDSVKNTIQYCYATGKVSATSDRASGNVKDFDVGGLVGKPEGTEILDCYALGDVFAEACSGAIPVCVGGIAGYLGYDTTKADTTTPTVAGTIQRCFATGSVTARSAASGPVYAGGIVGYVAQSTTGLKTTATQNVARGALILAESADALNRKAGRVYGASVGSGTCAYFDISANYGLVTMKTGIGEYYDTASPSIPTSGIGLSDTNGADVANNTSSTAPGGIKTQGFWTTTLNFNAATWNFSDVGYRGYPLLK
jgi:hypothetical protein